MTPRSANALPHATGQAAASLSSSRSPSRLRPRDPFSRSLIPSNDIGGPPSKLRSKNDCAHQPLERIGMPSGQNSRSGNSKACLQPRPSQDQIMIKNSESKRIQRLEKNEAPELANPGDLVPSAFALRKARAKTRHPDSRPTRTSAAESQSPWSKTSAPHTRSPEQPAHHNSARYGRRPAKDPSDRVLPCSSSRSSRHISPPRPPQSAAAQPGSSDPSAHSKAAAIHPGCICAKTRRVW